MRWDDVYLGGCAVALGPPEPVDDAVADGRYDPAFRQAHDYASVSIAPGRDAADLAVDAARAAVARAGTDPADVAALIHTYTTQQCPPDVQPASYIHGRAVGGRARALEVRQGCNGAVAALEVGAMYLTGRPAAAVVLTSGDKHHTEDDRYRSDQGCVPADGATAAVLTRGTGVARVLATEIAGDGGFTAPAVDHRQFATRAQFRAEQRRRLLPMLRAMTETKRGCLRTALTEAGVKAADVTRWVLPNSGRFLVDADFRAEFGIEDAATTWAWGRTIGHLTVGDQIAGLNHLLESGAVRAGDLVVLLSDGVGFSYGSAVLEIVRPPNWSAAGA